MAHHVAWTESAWQEPAAPAEYIARDLRGRIVPELGETSVGEVFVKQYRLIYEVDAGRVTVLAFLHGARQFPYSF